MTADEFDLLVVEDEAVILEAARKVLTAEGLRTDLAPDGDLALQKAAARRYRAVVCDLVLPRVRGYELVAKIRDLLPRVPIILITGYATVENATEGFKQGVFDFIPKPFDYGELLGVVQRALALAGSTGRGDRRPSLGDRESRVFSLGQHAWACLETDGSARIGIGETFASLDGRFEHLELPAVGDHLLQGNPCARWTTPGRLVHRIWSPLSGRVTETNSGPFGDPSKRTSDNAPDNWIIHLVPSDLGPELSKLMRL